MMCCLLVLQQGSGASSSKCGSTDVLEALGVNIDLGPEVLPYSSSCTQKWDVTFQDGAEVIVDFNCVV